MNHRNKSLSTVSRLRVLLITLVHWRHLGLKSSQWSVSEMNRNDDAILLYQCSLLSSTNLPTASLQNSLQRLQAKHLHRIHQIVQLQGPYIQDLLGSWPGGPVVTEHPIGQSDPKRMVGDDFTTCVFSFSAQLIWNVPALWPRRDHAFWAVLLCVLKSCCALNTHHSLRHKHEKNRYNISSFIDLSDPNSNVDAFFHFGGESFLILRLMLSTCSWSRRLLSVQISISIYWRLQDTWNKTHQTGSQEDSSETLIYLYQEFAMFTTVHQSQPCAQNGRQSYKAWFLPSLCLNASTSIQPSAHCTLKYAKIDVAKSFR